MAAKARFYLRSPKSDKPTIIIMKYYFNGQRFTYSVGEEIHPKDWNENQQRVRKSHPYADALNMLIDKIEIEVKNIILTYRATGKRLTREALKRELNNRTSKKKQLKTI